MRSVSVIGATGLVGGRIFRRLRAQAGDRLSVSGTGFRRAAGLVTRLDVTDASALAAHLARGFDVVVFAAGTKDVERCERDPAHALALNATPLRRMAEIVRREGLGTRLVHLSTDYVFDGERGRYREEDPPAPRTEYGRSKLLGERAVLDAPGDHHVVRSGAVMGRGARFFDWLLAELRADREIRLFEDCFASPTPAELLADSVAELVSAYDQTAARIVHAVGDRRMSRLELGRAIAGLVPGHRAVLVPEGRAAGGPFFQPDLSLVQSELARALQREPLEEYLAAELRGP